MEIFCCDEAVLQKIAAAEMQLLPEGINLKAMADSTGLKNLQMASAFDSVDLGWIKIPAIAQLVGDVAVVKVDGALIGGNAGFKRLFGITGYEDIKSAVAEAILRPDVAGVLMWYNTPGGSTSGLKATAEFLSEASKKKPMVGFANSAASAGYWLASSTGKLYADEMSILGSIGTILQLVSYKKANDNMGVEYNTFKSGSLKMAGNPNEDMSEEAKAYFQQIVDDMTTIFYKSVSGFRSMNYDRLRKNFGDGRAVLGARALAGGLVDDLGGAQAAMKGLRRQIAAKTSKK